MSVEAILEELRRQLNTSVIAHGLISSALRGQATYLRSLDARARSVDPRIHLRDPHIQVLDDFDESSSGPQASMKRSEALAQLSLNGPIDIHLSQQWIVSWFAKWDEVFRPQLAKEHGCPGNAIKVPLFGDLRLLRNSVVHNEGRVSGNWTQSEVLADWFEPGDIIHLTGRHFHEFERSVPWEYLRTGPS